MNRTVAACLACLMLVMTGLTRTTATAVAQEQECSYTGAEKAAIEAAAERLEKARILRRPGEVALNVMQSASLPVTRAEFATILARALGRDDEAQQLKAEVSFSDMANHWAAGYVELLHQEGIVKGYPGGHFSPGENISLVHAKIMLARLIRLQVGATSVEIDSALQRTGIDTDVPCTTDGTATRAQVFLLVDRSLSAPFYARFQNR